MAESISKEPAMTELKACPNPECMNDDLETASNYIGCPCCGVQVTIDSTGKFDLYDLARRRWNALPRTPETRDLREALEAIAEEAGTAWDNWARNGYEATQPISLVGKLQNIARQALQEK